MRRRRMGTAATRRFRLLVPWPDGGNRAYCLGPAAKRRFCRENRTAKVGVFLVARTFAHDRLLPPACLCARCDGTGPRPQTTPHSRTRSGASHEPPARRTEESQLTSHRRTVRSAPPVARRFPSTEKSSPQAGPLWAWACASTFACFSGGRGQGERVRPGPIGRADSGAAAGSVGGARAPRRGPTGGPARRPPPPRGPCRPG